jgi:hypothetical protein
MDSGVNQLARELTEAIASAVADDPRVAACRERAKAAGYDLRVSLEAVIGFAQRGATGKAEKTKKLATRSTFEMSANDRRFLKSLRISADEPTEKVD